MQANQLYLHSRTKRPYRVLIPWVAGKSANGNWADAVVYVGCYDGKVRWTDADRWGRNFEPAPGRVKKQIDGES